MNLLYNLAETRSEVTCYATNGGICYLQNPCESYSQGLWQSVIKIAWDDS